MKWFTSFFILILISAESQGQTRPSKLLFALGQEEKILHVNKRQGPRFELNQRLISELVQIPNLEASPELISKLDHRSSTTTPSLVILEAILTTPNSWYIFTKDGAQVQQSIAQELMKEFMELGPEVFLNYLQGLQTEAPTPDCLVKHVKGLQKLQTKIKWLEDENGLHSLLKNPKALKKLFDRINPIGPVYEKCRLDIPKKTPPPKTP